MNSIHEHVNEININNLSIVEVAKLRRQCAKSKDLDSLFKISIMSFNKWPLIDECIFPEICYYFGRLNRQNEISDFFKGKECYVREIPKWSIDLGKALLGIGQKFPNLNEFEVSFLEKGYSNVRTYPLFDIIMFDCELLPRKIMRLNSDILNIRNSDFTRDLLILIYDCFIANNNIEAENTGEDVYVYSRTNNSVTQKKEDFIGVGEYYIDSILVTNKLWRLVDSAFEEKHANELIKYLYPDEDLIRLKNSDYNSPCSESIELAAKQIFTSQEDVEKLKCIIAKKWLVETNERDQSII